MCLPAREEPLSLRMDGAQSYGLGAPGVTKFRVLSHVYPPLARPRLRQVSPLPGEGKPARV
jgi:hypothetical protein